MNLTTMTVESVARALTGLVCLVITVFCVSICYGYRKDRRFRHILALTIFTCGITWQVQTGLYSYNVSIFNWRCFGFSVWIVCGAYGLWNLLGPMVGVDIYPRKRKDDD